MRAGALNRRLSIDQPVISQNETGEEIINWSERAVVWASIEPIRGKEALIAGANLASMDTKIRFRWSRTVDELLSSKWRMRYKGTIYDVVSLVQIATGKREVEVLAKSGTNYG
jgi:SPP1 family predicted phage head-tail adaptor